MRFKDIVIQICKKIPSSKVTTYGAIAVLAGNPSGAREVGYILHSLSERFSLPWHRVINKNGYLSIRGKDVNMKSLQKTLLEQEGIEVSKDFMVDLSKYGWFGKDARGPVSSVSQVRPRPSTSLRTAVDA